VKGILCRIIGLGIAIVLAGALWAPLDAGAAGFELQFNQIFSGTIPPAASPPWVDATFEDVGGGVLVTIANVGLSTGEFVSEVDFNLNPGYDPTGPGSLTFALQSQSGVFDLPTISGAMDAFKADGDGNYDVQFLFSTQDGASHRFMDSSSVSYLISGISGLQASDFAYVSSGSKGGLYSATHIQGINSGANSVWANPSQVSQIPEPNPSVLFILAASLLWGGVLFRLKRPKGP
jgi:hypothetical protein